MSDRESFGLYLETTGPGEAAERMRRRVGPDAVGAAHSRWSGRLTGPQTTVEDVTASLGQPDESSGLTLSYALATRPGYIYTFDFDSHARRLRASGFTRVDAIAFPPGALSDVAQLPLRLAQVGATAEEVRTWLGAPVREYGWWPIETWEYRDGLTLQLRHGVVEGTT